MLFLVSVLFNYQRNILKISFFADEFYVPSANLSIWGKPWATPEIDRIIRFVHLSLSFVLHIISFRGIIVLISNMVIGCSEIGAHLSRKIGNLFCIRHLIRSRAVTPRILFPKRPIFLHSCATCSELPATSTIYMSRGFLYGKTG